jgi:ATP-dependent Clp protease protease subunit
MSKIFGRIIPSVTDESDGISRSYDLYSRLLKDRIIMLHGAIEEQSASIIIMQLLILEAENKEKPIYIYINSPGGCVYSCLSILDTMQCIKCPIFTVGLGLVASAASIILSCGKKGSRFCLPNTRIMIHQPHGGAEGQVTDIEIQTKEMLFLKNTINDILAGRSGESLAQIKKLMERDKYFSPEEAQKIGIIDKILTGNFDDKSKVSR